ncbi:glycosyltransferase family 2 protein [Catalinimonas sp. 4WD22]|uniref:glycosyltransferase family 2 protein n=1 Tax=Catalinimonas locisalis TaxID=3133978 RepID=UPI003100A9CC
MKVSVLTPSYNSGKYIERAIQSVLKQDYKNWEHIIVDGQSKDNTLNILNKYPHLKWISETDQGQSDAMNKAFSMSSGDIIVYLNADDELKENVFITVLKEFEDPQVDFVLGKLEKVNQWGESKVITPSTDIFRILLYWPCAFPLNPVSYYYRRHVQQNIGDFPIDNHLTMDYWFLLRAYHRYHIHKVDKILGLFYTTVSNKSSDAQKAKQSLKQTRNQFLIEQKNFRYFLFLTKHKLFKALSSIVI